MILKEKREELELKQEYVAHLLGIEPSSYSRYESCKRQPRAEHLFKLEEILGVSVRDILWDYLNANSQEG